MATKSPKVVRQKVVAYIRVSTGRQDADNQKLEILELANDRDLGPVDFVEETVSGKRSWRDRKLYGSLEALQRGDVLIVAELSRLGRSMLEIIEILSRCTQRGVRIYAAKGHWALDDSLQSKVVAMALALASEIERDLISQRTKSALATKKAQGVVLGRPKGPGKSKLDTHDEEIRGLLAIGVPQIRIAKKYQTTPRNLWNWMRKRKIGKDGTRAA
jgi:DNA invertase Pin-like site-specific DNA recombinase